MLYNFPFVPGKFYRFSQAQIGGTYLESGGIQVSDQVHTERTLTSGFGGATKIDVKGYTITGKISAYIARSGNAPHTISTNLPERGAIVRFRIWTGGFYAEGDGLITQRDADVQPGKMGTLELSFESDGIWQVTPNVVEAI